MEGVLQVQMPPLKRKRSYSIDYSLCVLCQKKENESLVAESKSSKKLLEALAKRSMFGDKTFECSYELLLRIGELLEKMLVGIYLVINGALTRWN